MSTAIDAAPPPMWSRVRSHWPLIAIVVLVSLLLSMILTWALRPPVYTAEARLAVGSGQMTALNIPGYPTASEAMASNYARWVNHQGVQGELAPEGTIELSASPIVDSNVLRVEATSLDPQIAVAAADEAADLLMEGVNQVADFNDPEALIAEIRDHVAPLLVARQAARDAESTYNDLLDSDASPAQVSTAFDTLVGAQQELITLELEQDGRRDRYRSLISSRSTEANLVEVSPAQIVGDDRVSTIQRNTFLAALGGLAIAAGIVWLGERRRDSPRAGKKAQADEKAQAGEKQ